MKLPSWWGKIKAPLIQRGLLMRVPKLGDPVWWAPKAAVGVVSKVGQATFEFSSGPQALTSGGKIVPYRYLTAARIEDASWDNDLQRWTIGTGPTPKNVRGQIVLPEPVIVSSQ